MIDFLRHIAFKLLLDSTQNRHNQFDMLQPTQEMNQYVNSEVKHLNTKGYCHGDHLRVKEISYLLARVISKRLLVIFSPF